MKWKLLFRIIRDNRVQELMSSMLFAGYYGTQYRVRSHPPFGVSYFI